MSACLTRSLRGRWLATSLVLLALAAFVVEGGSVPHSHATSQPAFFNHDHDLTSCATLSGGPIPASPPAMPLAVVLAAAAPATAPTAVAAQRGLAEPRAPPLA